MKSYAAKEFLDHIHDCKKNESIKSGMNGVMTPYLTDAELDEYVKERSGEVVSYKLAEVEI